MLIKLSPPKTLQRLQNKTLRKKWSNLGQKEGKRKIWHKYHNNTNMFFSLPPCAIFLTHLHFPRVQFFQRWSWGRGLGTRDRELHCLFSWKSRSFIYRYGKNLRHTSQTPHLKICHDFSKNWPIFKRAIFAYLFLSGIEGTEWKLITNIDAVPGAFENDNIDLVYTKATWNKK